MLSVFSFPTTIVFGEGAIDELPARLAKLGAKRPLLVTDPGLTKTAAFAQVQKILSGVRVFSAVTANPTEQNVIDASDVLRKCDSVIALGGGSAIDVGKIARVRIAKPQAEFARWDWQQTLPKLAPFVAIPTTAGTGSEVGRSSVIVMGGKKHVIFHPALMADLVILDPTLTEDLPAKLTAATGADALTHCIESFTSPVFHPLCDGIALEGIRLIARALPVAVKEPKNLDARGKMQIAATMGGIAFQKDLGAVHSLAHPLSALCGLHHGTANALCLPAVMKFNESRKPGVYARVAEAMETSDAIGAVERLFDKIGLTGGLRAAGVKDEQLDALADQAFEDSCHQTNPVPVTRGDLLELYRTAM